MSSESGLINRPPVLLRRSLLADAVASGGVGLLMAVAAAPLEGLLGLPAALMRGAGIFLLFYAAFVLFVGLPARISTAGARTIVAANALWAVASVLLLLSGMVQPTVLGYAFVIGQALVVAVLGLMQYNGLKSAV